MVKKMEGLKDLSGKNKRGIDPEYRPAITKIISNASMIYFAGRNNGVAEELALKTNEITRKNRHFRGTLQYMELKR